MDTFIPDILQLKGGLAAKNLDHDRELLFLTIDLVDNSREAAEGPRGHLDGLAYYVVVTVFVEIHEFIGSAKHSLDLALAQRLGSAALSTPSEKVDDIAGILQQIHHLAGQLCFDENVS